MPNDAEIEARFWKELKSAPVVMLGLDGARDGHAQPMTAIFEEDGRGPLWFFAASDNSIIASLGQTNRAMAHFVAKGHDLFATIHGSLSHHNDRATIDRLWNPHVAAWYEGKDDPRIALLKLDTESAQIWLNASSIGAAIKRLFGRDPKEDYQGKVAEVAL
jgi:general stress protein 26